MGRGQMHRLSWARVRTLSFAPKAMGSHGSHGRERNRISQHPLWKVLKGDLSQY